ncbi:MAG: SGNH/GDSL hydrolase family protein [Bacteroidales bacterium]
MKMLGILICIGIHMPLLAQNLVYVNAEDLDIIGKANPTPMHYHRIDTMKYNNMPQGVKNLFTNSAGLAIAFKTNSNIIAARWTTASSYTLTNMTAIVGKGLDLYIKRDEEWIFAGVGRPTGDSSSCRIVENMQDGEKECLLYLPLYDEIRTLEIGVSEGHKIETMKNPFKKKVIIYGSSILQGASASRPGMAYPSRMTRKTDLDFINLGLSGRGKMEHSVANMLADIEADAYILDCAPNPSPEEITERTEYLVNTIRKQNAKAPIIMIQSVVRESGNFDMKARARVEAQNRNFKKEFEKLQASGVENIYYIEGDLLGSDHEGTTDGVHPNDLGFDRMLRVIEPAVIDVFQKHDI